MTPNKLCASLEPCQKLVELGVRLDDTYFVWVHTRERGWFLYPRNRVGLSYTSDDKFIEDNPAPTVAELLEVLPAQLYEYDSLLTLKKFGDRWEVCYMRYHGELRDGLADALCAMLIWIITEGIITKEKINEM